MFRFFKNCKGGIFLGFGLGVLAAIFLPLNCWLITISIILIISGIKLIIQKKKGGKCCDCCCKKNS